MYIFVGNRMPPRSSSIAAGVGRVALLNLTLLALLLQMVNTEPLMEVTGVTRHYQGDIYTLQGGRGRSCGCSSYGGITLGGSPGVRCQCQCPKAAPTFRDDQQACVSDIKECPLAEFMSSGRSEKIPYVFMPFKGQLVHPTAEVALLGLQHGGSPLLSPVCVVTKGQVLTHQDWEDMDNTPTFEPPFRLYRDNGKTYIQWVGEQDARRAAEGRLILVKLICRDAARPDMPLFSPCLAFRVAGSPGSSLAGIVAAPSSRGQWALSDLNWWETATIGVVAISIAFIFVVAIFIYARARSTRKKRIQLSRERVVEEGVRTTSKMSRGTTSKMSRGGGGHRKRPPLKPSLTSEDDSEQDDIEDLSVESKNRRNRDGSLYFTTAMVHDGQEQPTSWTQTQQRMENNNNIYENNMHGHDFQTREIIDENEDYEDDDQADDMTMPVEDEDIADSTDPPGVQGKRKLYFNPEYFQPELLQSPPPAALEFLSRIRDMINIAKNKMKSKSYQPNLNDIPEDDYSLSQSSRPSTIGRSSRLTATIAEETEDELDEDTKSKYSFPTDSLERPKDGDSRNSTLKRLASRVNQHGQSLVSEIIKTLDLKPRLPPQEVTVYDKRQHKSQTPKPPPPRPVNAREVQEPEVIEDDFPELIKPSMLRSVMRDGKRLTEVNNTFENFRQEMMATFHKIKKVGEVISPKSTLNRKKKKEQYSPANTLERLRSENGGNEGKVQKWLQNLENKNSYSRMTDGPNVVFDSRKVLSKNNSPPPLPEKSTKAPDPPKKKSTYGSTNLNEEPHYTTQSSLCSEDINERNDIEKSVNSQESERHEKIFNKPTTRIRKDKYNNSNVQGRESETPILSNNEHKSTYGSVEGPLNESLYELHNKIPKNISSDNESVYSHASNSLSRNSFENENNGRNKTLSRKVTYKESSETDYGSTYGSTKEFKPNKRDIRKIIEENIYEEMHIKRKDGNRLKKTPSFENKVRNSYRYNEDENSESSNVYKDSDNNNEDSVSGGVPSGEFKNEENILTVRKHYVANYEKLSTNNEQKNSSFLHSLKRKDLNSNKIHEDVEPYSIGTIVDKPVSEKNVDDDSYNKYDFRDERNYGETKVDKHMSHSLIKKQKDLKSINTQNPGSVKMKGDVSKSINSNSRNRLKTFNDYQAVHNISKQQGEENHIPVNSNINIEFNDSSHSIKYQKEVRPPLPPKNSKDVENDNIFPVLPPKGSKIKPPLPAKSGRKLETSDLEIDKPKLPQKSKRKQQSDPIYRSSSTTSIPELSEEQARSILHGLLAHPPHDPNKLPSVHEEDGGSFLGVGNTSDDSEDSGSVPNYETGSTDSFPSTSSASPGMLDREREDDHILSHKNYHSSDERLCGEFILTTIDRSPSLNRQSSLNRGRKMTGTYSALAKLLDMTDAEISGESGLTKGMEIALALKAKTELEKHFKEKSGADSIKRTWRRILEKADDTKENKDKISIMQLQQYMASLERKEKEKESKQKQDDSGYQSTDSNESNTRASSSELSLSSLNSLTPKGLYIAPTSKNSTSSKLFQRSISLQQLAPSTYESYSSYESDSIKRSSLRSSFGRRHIWPDGIDSMSVYVNNNFKSSEHPYRLHM